MICWGRWNGGGRGGGGVSGGGGGDDGDAGGGWGVVNRSGEVCTYAVGGIRVGLHWIIEFSIGRSTMSIYVFYLLISLPMA